MKRITSENRTEPEAAEQPDKVREQALKEAVERVYRWYGRDLDAFHRAVQRDIEALKRAGSARTAC
jgi:DNA-binding Lrp family transcriptional regulator